MGASAARSHNPLDDGQDETPEGRESRIGVELDGRGVLRIWIENGGLFSPTYLNHPLAEDDDC